VGSKNLEETVVGTNLEAAEEVARQLRLRDIGGMILIDFIDMLLEQNKRRVVDTLKEEMARDKTRSQVFDISPLGLLEVTRKRVSGGLLESFSETCPTCEGRGVILTYEA
jgi:ribonuclease E